MLWNHGLGPALNVTINGYELVSHPLKKKKGHDFYTADLRVVTFTRKHKNTVENVK